jgi:tetratricopeptide (TPR) repeat protein
VVVWIDDAAGDPAREALVQIALAAGRVLVVAAARDPDVLLGELVIALDPLDVATARQLLADWVGLAPALVADLADRSAGDIGLALAMVRDGVRTGRLAPGPAGLRTVAPGPLPLPPSAIASWERHLPRADGGRLWTALERAATFGPSVPRALLGEEAAEAEALVLARGLGVATPDGWRWASPALQAAILAHAGDRLGDHHLACAAACGEDRWARGRHLLAAGRVLDGVEDIFAASSDVIAGGGMAEGARMLEQAEEALRAADIPESNIAWGRLHRSRGHLGPTHQGYTRCREHNEKALALCRRYDADPAWRRLRIGTVGGLAFLANIQFLPRVARPYLDEEAALLAEEGRASSYHLDRWGWHALTLGDPVLAVRCFGEAVEVATATGIRHIRYTADASLGIARARAGDPAGITHLTRAGAAMLEAGFLSARADLASALGDLERHRGRFDAAEAHYDEALRATAEGEARADLGFRIGLALLFRDTGRPDRARAELDTCRRLLTDEGPTWEALLALYTASVEGDSPAAHAALTAIAAQGYSDPDVEATRLRIR